MRRRERGRTPGTRRVARRGGIRRRGGELALGPRIDQAIEQGCEGPPDPGAEGGDRSSGRPLRSTSLGDGCSDASRLERRLRAAHDDRARSREVVASDRRAAGAELHERRGEGMVGGWRHRRLLPWRPARSRCLARGGWRSPSRGGAGLEVEVPAERLPAAPRPPRTGREAAWRAEGRQVWSGDGTFCSGNVLPNRTRSRQLAGSRSVGDRWVREDRGKGGCWGGLQTPEGRSGHRSSAGG